MVGFTGVFIIFSLFWLKNIDCGYSLELPLWVLAILSAMDLNPMPITYLCRWGNFFFLEKKLSLSTMTEILMLSKTRSSVRSDKADGLPGLSVTELSEAYARIWLSFMSLRAFRRPKLLKKCLHNCRLGPQIIQPVIKLNQTVILTRSLAIIHYNGYTKTSL